MAKTDTKTTAKAKAEHVNIPPPNFKIVQFLIRGDAPYVQNKFPQKALQEMHDKQEAGSTAKKGAKRAAKNFQDCYEAAMHKSKEGWCGIPAASFRNAAISACKVCGFHMTKAKLSIFCMPDGFDPADGTPLVKITKGKPHYSELPVRNATGVIDLRARPMWGFTILTLFANLLGVAAYMTYKYRINWAGVKLLDENPPPPKARIVLAVCLGAFIVIVFAIVMHYATQYAIIP